MRILLAGRQGFTEEVLELLNDDTVEIVGWAESAGEATQLIDALHPDFVVADSTLVDAAEQLASSAAVVFLPPRPSRVAGAPAEDDPEWQLDLLRTSFALASATPPASSDPSPPDLNGG